MDKIQLQKMLDAYEFHHILKAQVVDVADRHSVRVKLPFSTSYALLSAAGNYHSGVLTSVATSPARSRALSPERSCLPPGK
jgi:hypothetical protein